MKANRHIPFWGIVTALLFSSCVKDTLYDTPHPNKGAVTITVQNTTAGDNYVAEIDGQTIDITSSPFTLPGLLEAGVYRLVIHNCPEGFTFDKSTAQVVALTDNTENSSNKDDNPAIIPLPGYLYTISQEITIAADDTLRVNAVPVQRVRDLQFELEITQGRPELIQTVTGTFNNIAGTFDMEQGQTSGEPVSTVLSFTREGSKLTANARLLGTMGSVQTLTLDIVFTDGGRTQRTEVDLTEAFADFNNDMTTSYRVTGTLETPVGMEECNAEITGWEPMYGDNVNAKM